ncbi:hypothetical protein SHKM778_82010 [Streptomyces sp. KM77-8]|uniref:Uncharacterized protein n=1 Tax=Streptomyces haneummycinicus TaxID=3074435 RepID=A0AAT9HXY6_9ACTN
MSRPSEWWAVVRVRAQGRGEKGSATDGTLTMEVAASADIVVHIAAVLRSRGRTPAKPGAPGLPSASGPPGAPPPALPGAPDAPDASGPPVRLSRPSLRRNASRPSPLGVS